MFLSALTDDSPVLAQMYGPLPAAFLVVVCGLKCLRSCYSDQSSQYLILTFTALFHQYDYNFIRQTFLVEYFIISIVYYKIYELLLKVSNKILGCINILILMFSGTICCNLHRSVANHVGQCISRFCSTVLCTTFCDALCASFYIGRSFNTTQSFFR